MQDDRTVAANDNNRLLAIVETVEAIDQKMESLLGLLAEESGTLLRMENASGALMPDALKIARDYRRDPTFTELRKFLQHRVEHPQEEAPPEVLGGKNPQRSKRWPSGSMRQLYSMRRVQL